MHNIELGTLISLFLSLALLLLSISQLFLARAERSRADVALEEAREVRMTAEELHQEQQRLSSRLEKLRMESFSNLCQATGGTFDFATGVCHLAGGGGISYSPETR